MKFILVGHVFVSGSLVHTGLPTNTIFATTLRPAWVVEVEHKLHCSTLFL